MLELRPNCEICNVDLSAQSFEAQFCYFKYTFCAAYINDLFKGVCPNSGGNLDPRPIRPTQAHRHRLNLSLTKRRQTRWQREEITAFVQQF